MSTTTLVSWVNGYISRKGHSITGFDTQWRDGLVLAALCDAICPTYSYEVGIVLNIEERLTTCFASLLYDYNIPYPCTPTEWATVSSDLIQTYVSVIRSYVLHYGNLKESS